MKCWASNISPCKGKQSREHLVSKGLLGTDWIQTRGLPFCEGEFVDIPVSNFTSNILCSGHNSQLSPLDSTVKFFRESLLARSTGATAPHSAHISGHNLSRWIAKTYCNLMTVGDYPLAPDFAEFAFDKPCSTSFHFYLWDPPRHDTAKLGHRIELVEDHFQFNHFYDDTGVIVFIKFYGMRLVLTNFNARVHAALEAGATLRIATRDLIERPTRFGLSHRNAKGKAIRSYEVILDW